MASKKQSSGNRKTTAKRRPAPQANQNTEPANQHPDPLVEQTRLAPASLSPHDARQLQQTIGNEAVEQLLKETAQPQPTVKPARAPKRAGDSADSDVAALVTHRQAATSQLVQAKLALPIKEPVPNWYHAISVLISEYNSRLEKAQKAVLFNEKERRLALETLQQIEVWVSAWFQRHRVPDLDAVPHGPRMKGFLNDVQKERIDLVAWSLKKWDKQPPVANFSTLDSKMRETLTEIWQRLVAGKQIDIQGDKDFRTKVLADFARLLETKTGRMMVGELVAGGEKVLVVKSTTLAGGGKFAASPDKEELQEILAVPEPDIEERKHYVALDFTPVTSVEGRKRVLNDVRSKHPQARGVAITADAGTRYFRFNVGTSSTMTIPVDSSDATLHSSGRAIGVHDEEIIAPTFINMAHELGHVLRSLQGISAGYHGGVALVSHAFPDVHSDMRVEEFFNIDAIENRIRNEAGLSKRGKHESWTGRLAMQLQMEVLGVREVLQKARQAEKQGAFLQQPQIPVLLGQLEKKCDDLIMPLAMFGKGGGDPRPLHDQVRQLRQTASQLPPPPPARIKAGQEDVVRMKPLVQRQPLQEGKSLPGKTGGQIPTKAPISRLDGGNRAMVQRFGIDDRRWDQVKRVRHLGATAYAAEADDGTVVIKRSGAGKIAYQLGTEGPVQETLAAKVGEIAAFGIKSVKTVMVQTAADEGQTIIQKLKTLGGTAENLATALEKTETFLVMEYGAGPTLEKAGETLTTAKDREQIQWFYGLGRLWVFDVILHNTDRFYAGNWGNVIIGPGGLVYGIDQMVGFAASDLGKDGPATELATREVTKVIDPKKRRQFSHNIYESLHKLFGKPFAALQVPFITHFERGILDAIIDAGNIPVEALKAKQAELPKFAAEAAASLGLGGAAEMLAVFKKNIPDAKKEASAVGEEITLRSAHREAITLKLAELSTKRATLLKTLADEAHTLMTNWTMVSKWWGGKAKYWQERQQQIDILVKSQQEDYFSSSLAALAAVKEEAYSDVLQRQITIWNQSMPKLWKALSSLTGDIKKTEEIKGRIEALQEEVQKERESKMIPDRL